MRRTAATILLLAMAAAAPAGDRTLVLPHALSAGETAWIEVQVGPVAHGREIDVTTDNGLNLGTISPFGVRFGQDAGTYTLPVPPDAIRNGRVSIRLTISQPGGPPRKPTPQEVKGVAVKIAPAPR
jgi:hypothetical protein